MMLRAEIKSFDAGIIDVEHWHPASSFETLLCVTFTIGLVGETGADNFEVTVATADALHAHGIKPDLATIFVDEFSWPDIRSTVEQWVAEARGIAWHQIAEELSKHMRYEYAGYRR